MRKKRRKAVYVPYDYEAAYMNSLDKMEEANEERILKEGKVKSIYATKEIRSGDQLEVEIYPEFTKGQKDQIPDEGKRKRQRQAQKNLNDKNSKKMCERVIGENFTDRDIWATFTYTDDNMPASMEVATKNMQNYIRRVFEGRLRLRRRPSFEDDAICGVTMFDEKKVEKKAKIGDRVLYKTTDGYWISGDPEHTEFIPEE